MAGEMQIAARAPRLLSWDGASEAQDEQTSQIRTIGFVLRDRWRLIAAFAAGGLVIMALVTLFMERRYTATAVVHVENDTPHVTKMDQVVSGSSYLESVEYFQDQVGLLKSRTLMAAVIRDLGLKDHRKAAAPAEIQNTHFAFAPVIIRTLCWI